MTIEQLEELLSKIPASAIISIFTVVIALVVLYIVGMWRIFEKAGESGWKCLIPIYNQYTLFKMFWKTSYFWTWNWILYWLNIIAIHLYFDSWIQSR